MAANFYDNSGVMAGCDFHKFIVFPAAPVLFHPHIVAAPFCWPPATFWKRTGTVKSDSWKMIQGGFDLYLVPHVPLPLPPGPMQLANYADVIIGSGSKAQMQVHSVTGEKNPLATCLASAFGLNINCQEMGLSGPTGIVLNVNSVETSPTLGDYLGALASWVVDAAIGWATNKLTEKMKMGAALVTHFLRRLGDMPYLKLLDIPAHVQNFVQRLVDEGPAAAVEGFKNDVKDILKGK